MTVLLGAGAAVAVFLVLRHRIKKTEFNVNHLYKHLQIPKPTPTEE